jgi:hypothetical protein
MKRAVTENFWLNINDPDMDIPGLVEYTNLRPLNEHVVYVPFYMPGEHPKYAEPDEVFLEKVKRYLKKINPSLSGDDFIDIRASRYRFAQPICEPGYLDGVPDAKLPVTWREKLPNNNHESVHEQAVHAFRRDRRHCRRRELRITHTVQPVGGFFDCGDIGLYHRHDCRFSFGASICFQRKYAIH